MSSSLEGAAPHRMSDVEALMWNLEKDPHLSASVANITVLDRSPDRALLLSRMQHAATAVPRLHQRVVPALGRLAPPEWRPDPDFDLEYHVRWMALPAPGTMRQLLDQAALIASQPFDRTRPLWQFVVVEGLEGGRASMIQHLHHTIADGEASLRMSEQFIDLERDASAPMAQARVPAPPDADSRLVDVTVDTLTHNLRRGLGVAHRAAAGAIDLATHPERLAGLGDTLELARSAVRQMLVTDHAHSTLWTARTLRRHIEVLQVPFDAAAAAAKALGGSLNDLFVTAAAGGAGAVHRAAGHTVDELRISMPVSTRRGNSAGGNAFTPSRVLVPIAIEDPAERFRAVHDRLAAAKGERALGVVDRVAGIANLLPTSLAVRMARQQVETVDFAISNLRGAPVPLFVAGARMEANYPVGPIGGTAWNLTLMSYNGQLDMGLNTDAGAVGDPAALRAAIETEFAALLAAGRRRRASRSQRSRPRPEPRRAEPNQPPGRQP
ncbi:MAG: wax ester/triacylglycerol synthase domain-containing protein [Acidimicrobiales bacterium]